MFLEESRVKNIATSLKDNRFLSFFFKRLKLNRTGKYEQEYPFVSPCGKEMNYVKPADIPIVFTSKIESKTISESTIDRGKGNYDKFIRNSVLDQGEKNTNTERSYLEYNNSGLTVPYDPQNLRLSSISGKLYYKLPLPFEKKLTRPHKTTKPSAQSDDGFQSSSDSGENDKEIKPYPGLHFGLLKSQLVLELEKDLCYGETAEDEDVLYLRINNDNKKNGLERGIYETNEKENSHGIIQIQTLPVEYEPFYGLLTN